MTKMIFDERGGLFYLINKSKPHKPNAYIWQSTAKDKPVATYATKAEALSHKPVEPGTYELLRRLGRNTFELIQTIKVG